MLKSFFFFFFFYHYFFLSCSLEEKEKNVEINLDGSIIEENINPESQPSRILPFRSVPGPPPQQYWVVFENQSPQVVELYYENSREGLLNGVLQPNDQVTIGTYVGHQFYYRKVGQSEKLYLTSMEHGKTHIIFEEEYIRNQNEQLKKINEKNYKIEYKNKNGIDWVAYYPRNPPIFHMFSADYVGQTHSVKSNHSYYTCYPETTNENDIEKCVNKNEIIEYEWEILSTSPKIMQLKGNNFLSDYEIDHIISIARPELKRSVVGNGGYEDRTRTSLNAWVKRSSSEIMDWIYRRIADVIYIPETHLWDTIGAESFQVVHYQIGQEYYAHHDWGNNREQTRYLTFLIYLNDQLNENAGGQTHFPHIDLKVHPGKAGVIAFYNILEDGNVDVKTLHAALPVLQGEKWLANVWIWDPNYS